MKAILLQQTTKSTVIRIVLEQKQSYILKTYCDSDYEPIILNELKNIRPLHLSFSIDVPNCIKKYIYDNKLCYQQIVVMPDFGIDLFTAICDNSIHINYASVYNQMFLAIEQFYQYIQKAHGDIKLENFTYCLDSGNIRLIDFQVGCHTVNYMSINCHDNKKLTIKDDFESLGYCILYSIVGDQLWFKKNELHHIARCKRVFQQQVYTNKKIYLLQQFVISSALYPESRQLMIDNLQELANIVDQIAD